MRRAMAALAALILVPATVVAQDATPGMTPTASPDAAATTTQEAPGPRIDWVSGGIELVADDLSLEVTDETAVHPPVTAPGEVLPQGSVHADDGTFEAWWYEHGIVQRLYLQLHLGKTHWWIDHIRAYDGQGDDSDWLYFEDLKRQTRTPLGESFVGDLDLPSSDASRESWQPPVSAVLHLDGLRLSAFMPGTRPARLTGCDHVVDKDVKVTWEAWPDGGGAWSTEYGDKVLQHRGEPLRGWKKMTPKEAEAALQAAGLCYRFDHSWPPAPRFEDPRLDAELEGYFDRRCSAPGTGVLTDVSFGPDWPSGKRGAIVYLEVQETEPRDWAEPPPYGTDCPSQ